MLCVRDQDTALLQDNHAAAQQGVAIVKHKHWRGLQTANGWNGASALVFNRRKWRAILREQGWTRALIVIYCVALERSTRASQAKHNASQMKVELLAAY